MEERKNNIINDSYFLINVFHKNGRKVTQLHVQKLMFLFEAYYMNVHEDESELYECQYQAWDFGPVATQLYKEFKRFGKDDIVLNKEQIRLGNEICEEKQRLIKNIYESFKEFSPTQLVNFTHADGSPWRNAWEKEHYSSIPKESMREWFKKYVK